MWKSCWYKSGRVDMKSQPAHQRPRERTTPNLETQHRNCGMHLRRNTATAVCICREMLLLLFLSWIPDIFSFKDSFQNYPPIPAHAEFPPSPLESLDDTCTYQYSLLAKEEPITFLVLPPPPLAPPPPPPLPPPPSISYLTSPLLASPTGKSCPANSF